MARVFISGVSDGIGLALATLYLEKGWTVFGIARRRPEKLVENENFIFKYYDLSNIRDVDFLLDEEFVSIAEKGVTTVHLNAGVSGNVPARAEEFSLNDIYSTLTVNTIANKVLLDAFLALSNKPKVIVASASIAGVRFRAGMLPYSLSKAALNAMCGVYAQENPDVFFAVLGMCNVHTKLSQDIVLSPRVSEFPEHILLRKRFEKPDYAVSPKQRANDILNIIYTKRDAFLTSGQFADTRTILEQMQYSDKHMI